jgi:tetraacyldisaccharide 4'-kinase
VFCAIGNPGGFSRTITSLGVEIVHLMAFRDHHCYTRADMQKIIRQASAHRADIILTTEKDMIKLPDTGGGVLALCIDFVIDADFYEEVFNAAFKSVGG